MTKSMMQNGFTHISHYATEIKEGEQNNEAVNRMRKFFFKQMVGIHFSRWKTATHYDQIEKRHKVEADTQNIINKHNDRVGVIHDAFIAKSLTNAKRYRLKSVFRAIYKES